MIGEFLKRIKRMRAISKLAYIEQRKAQLRDDIQFSRQELFRLAGKAEVIRHDLRMM